MTGELAALVAHARRVTAEDRTRFARRLHDADLGGGMVVETCHRVEVYGSAATLAEAGRGAPVGTEHLAGMGAARHLIRLAVGRESVIVGEDQVLHQLRRGVQAARQLGPLTPPLDRLADIAMGAGRRARSWLPRRRDDLAAVALGRAEAAGWSFHGPVLVVGAGQMARLAAQAAIGRGRAVAIANRTPERGRALADQMGLQHIAFDPGPAYLERTVGVIVAIAGRWPLKAPSREALATGRAWVIDLSAPPALDAGLCAALGQRLLTIDDLALSGGAAAVVSDELAQRLDGIVESALAGYGAWLAGHERRDVARALAERAERERAAELDALWHRLPDADAATRAEVERMAERLTRRILREPLARLGEDGDGRRARAAQDFFGL